MKTKGSKHNRFKLGSPRCALWPATRIMQSTQDEIDYIWKELPDKFDSRADLLEKVINIYYKQLVSDEQQRKHKKKALNTPHPQLTIPMIKGINKVSRGKIVLQNTEKVATSPAQSEPAQAKEVKKLIINANYRALDVQTAIEYDVIELYWNKRTVKRNPESIKKGNEKQTLAIGQRYIGIIIKKSPNKWTIGTCGLFLKSPKS